MPELQIARIETFLFDPGLAKNLLFCRVETEEGVHGWGEAYVTPGKEPVIEHLLQTMAKYMIGRSAFNIRHTAQVVFDDFAMRRASLDSAVRMERDRDRAMGHRGEAREAAAVQPAGRRFARAGEGVCERLVERQRID